MGPIWWIGGSFHQWLISNLIRRFRWVSYLAPRRDEKRAKPSSTCPAKRWGGRFLKHLGVFRPDPELWSFFLQLYLGEVRMLRTKSMTSMARPSGEIAKQHSNGF